MVGQQEGHLSPEKSNATYPQISSLEQVEKEN